MTLPARIKHFGLGGDEHEIKAVWYFEVGSGTTGTVTIPEGGTLRLDEFATQVDALCVAMSGVGGFPTWKTVEEADSTIVVVSSFNAAGNYVLSGTPASFPIAVIFVYSVIGSDYDIDLDILEHEIPGGGSGTSDHGALTGLADDDHIQYHNDARGDARYYTETELSATAGAGLIGTDTTGFDTILSSADDTVQKSLDTLDEGGVPEICIVNEVAGINVKDVVHISGATGDKAQVSLADNTVHAKSHILGMAVETKANNQNIRIMRLGFILSVDTSMFSAGDRLHLITAGAVQVAIPTSGAHIHVGWVTKVDAVDGIILVDPDKYVHDIRGVDDQQVEIACGDDDATGQILFQDYSRTSLGYMDGTGVFRWFGDTGIGSGPATPNYTFTVGNLLNVDDTNDLIGIKNAPVAGTTVFVMGNIAAVDNTGTDSNRGLITRQHDNGIVGALYSAVKSRGTFASPLSTIDGDFSGFFTNFPYNGNIYKQAGAWGFVVDGVVTGSTMPISLCFITTEIGNEGLTGHGIERMIIKPDGKIGIDRSDPDGMLDVNCNGSTVPGIIVRGTASQTGSLFQLLDSSTNVFINAGDGLTGSEFVGNEQGVAIGFRWEGATEEKLLLVNDAGNDEVRLGDGDTNYVCVDNIGDMVFVGGAGLAFGEIYFAATSFDTVLAAQDTFYQILGFDTDGNSNNTTPDHTSDHITIIKTGKYFVTISVTSRSAAANNYEFELRKNNGVASSGNIHMHRTTSVANRLDSSSVSGICSFTANDTAELWVQRTDGGAVSKTIIIEHVNLALTMIGG